MELEHTSGTSEERTPLLLARGWWAEQEERALRLNRFVAGVLDEFPEARRVTINSPVCSGDICYTGVPSRRDRMVGNALFVSLSRYPFLWSEAELARMAAEAVEWQPQFLDVDPVYGVVFALYCERRGIRLPSLRFIVGSYEFVSAVHRRILERVFGVPVFNLYGSTETGHLLMEVGRGEMRPSLETALLEVLNTDAQGVGELAVTTLTNEFMPLIRYRIGDLVERHERPYYTSYLVHGRAKDAFVAPDGRRVTTWQIDQCVADVAGIAHYQLCSASGRRVAAAVCAGRCCSWGGGDRGAAGASGAVARGERQAGDSANRFAGAGEFGEVPAGVSGEIGCRRPRDAGCAVRAQGGSQRTASPA